MQEQITPGFMARFRVQTWLHRSVIAGVVIFDLGFLRRSSISFETELINKILLFGVLVIVPLGLIVATRDKHERDSLTFRLVALAQPLGAIAVAGSFLFEQGIAAALLASFWFVVTGLMVIHGVARLLDRRARGFEEISVSAGLIFIVIGSSWLIVSRHVQPLGFGETIILLTGVHPLRGLCGAYSSRARRPAACSTR